MRLYWPEGFGKKNWVVCLRIVRSSLHCTRDRFWRIGRVQFRIHWGSRFGSGNTNTFQANTENSSVDSEGTKQKPQFWILVSGTVSQQEHKLCWVTTRHQPLKFRGTKRALLTELDFFCSSSESWRFDALMQTDTKKGITLRTELDIDTASHTAQDCTCGSRLSCGDIPCGDSNVEDDNSALSPLHW